MTRLYLVAQADPSPEYFPGKPGVFGSNESPEPVDHIVKRGNIITIAAKSFSPTPTQVHITAMVQQNTRAATIGIVRHHRAGIEQ